MDIDNIEDFADSYVILLKSTYDFEFPEFGWIQFLTTLINNKREDLVKSLLSKPKLSEILYEDLTGDDIDDYSKSFHKNLKTISLEYDKFPDL